jgi:NAD(P)-dependent dehydrogenase (short-subunit alcohol dehydrogenase family)
MAASVDFAGRTVIVTGAGNGLGRAHAHEIGRLGGNVVVNDLGGSTDGTGASADSADFVTREIVAAGGTAVANYDSVATDEGCQAIVAGALASFGRIDAVVHNAGILRNDPFERMSDDRFFPVLETHLLGAFYLSRAVWPTMVARRYGRLVFTSSGSGVFGRVNGANYATAKAGIVGLCNALALEGEPFGILANCVMPTGTTRLGGAPDARDASDEANQRRAEALRSAPRSQPEWVSPLVAYLASEACATTHRYYSAIGGRYARIAIGVGWGWTAPEGAPPAPEEIAQHMDEISELKNFEEPASVFEEIEMARRPRS